MLQHAATRCNALQHTSSGRSSSTCQLRKHYTATHCNTLQHTATQCNTLQHTSSGRSSSTCQLRKHYTATHCNTLQHTATRCNVDLPSTGCAPARNTQHTALHCTTLQHAATHCNTLHHIEYHQLYPSHRHAIKCVL